MSARETISFLHDGVRYHWTDSTGFVDDHWQRPPQVIERVLAKKLEVLLVESDFAITDLGIDL